MSSVFINYPSTGQTDFRLQSNAPCSPLHFLAGYCSLVDGKQRFHTLAALCSRMHATVHAGNAFLVNVVRSRGTCFSAGQFRTAVVVTAGLRAGTARYLCGVRFPRGFEDVLFTVRCSTRIRLRRDGFQPRVISPAGNSRFNYVLLLHQFARKHENETMR